MCQKLSHSPKNELYLIYFLRQTLSFPSKKLKLNIYFIKLIKETFIDIHNWNSIKSGYTLKQKNHFFARQILNNVGKFLVGMAFAISIINKTIILHVYKAIIHIYTTLLRELHINDNIFIYLCYYTSIYSHLIYCITINLTLCTERRRPKYSKNRFFFLFHSFNNRS